MRGLRLFAAKKKKVWHAATVEYGHSATVRPCSDRFGRAATVRPCSDSVLYVLDQKYVRVNGHAATVEFGHAATVRE